MADGTVRGTFELGISQPIKDLRAARLEAAKVDESMRKLGDRMESTAGKASRAWAKTRSTIDRESSSIEVRIDRLDRKLEEFGRKRATPTVELRGFDRMNAQLSILEARMDRLSRQRATPSVGLGGGLLGPGGGGALSRAGGGGGGIPTAAKLGLAGAALLPGIQALGVSATGILGSASGAVLGAGAAGIGGFGTLGVGVGASVGAGKGAVKELQEITKEQTKYTEAVRKYGEASKQAAVARRELLHSESMVAPGVGTAARQVSITRAAYRKATAPGRTAFAGMIGNVAAGARSALPAYGSVANQASGATARAGTNFGGFLTGDQSQRTAMTLTKEYVRDLPVIERALENVTSTVEHLAVAARPFFHEGVVWVQTWTHGLAQNSSNEARVQHTMKGLVQDTKDWGKLAGATFRTVRDIFSMGKPSGDSMVVSLTHTLDRWDTWIQRNPAKVQRFFSEAQTTTEKIAGAMTGIVHLLSEAATAMGPLFNRAMALIRIASSLGPLGTAAGGALIYGAARGAKGGGGGAGRSLLGTAVLGRPFGAGMVGGVAGGAAVAGASRAGFLAARRGVTSRGAIMLGPASVGPEAVLARRAAAAEGSSAFGGVRGAASRVGQSRVGGALAGGAKTLGATVAIMAALEAAGKGGSFGQVTQNFASGTTMGLIHPADTSGARGASWATQFMGGIPQTLSPEAQQAVLGRKIARDLNRPFSERKGFAEANMGEFLGKNTRNTFGGGAVNPNAPNFMAQVGSQLKQLEGTGGGHAANVTQEIKALRTAWQEAKASADAYKKSRNEALNVQSEQHALQISSQFGGAFNIERKGGRSATGAFGDVTGGALSSLKSMRGSGRKVLAENTLAWATQLAKGKPELMGPVDDLTKKIKKRFHDLGQDIQIVNGHILTGASAEWQNISTAMSEPMERAKERMSAAFTAIQREAVGSLRGMGYTPAEANAMVRNFEKGTSSPSEASPANARKNQATSALILPAPATHNKKNARGGMIGGKGLLDTVPVPGGMAAPGEAWIANRHTMNDLSRATLAKFGKTAWQMISSEHRGHSERHNATGGYYPGPQGRIDQGVDFAGPGPVRAVLDGTVRSTGLWPGWPGSGGIVYDTARGPVYVMENFAPSVKVGAHLTQGQIIGQDLGGRYGIETGWADSAGTGPLVRYNGLKDGTPTAGGKSFAAFLGGAGGGGAMSAAAAAIKLHGRNSGLRGIPGALANAGSAKYAAGLQHQINKSLSKRGRVTPVGAQAGGGAPSANEALGRQMMLGAGWGASEWPALKALWTQESGWDANSVNKSSGAYGIPQSLGHGHPFNLGDAGAQIAWGLNYIRGRYGSPSAAEAHEKAYNWYSHGGKAAWGGWNAAGGSFETKGPTIFGAGERGKERVNITPIGRGGGGGHQITVKIGHVSMQSGADVENVAKEVAAKILDALDEGGASGTSDRELVG